MTNKPSPYIGQVLDAAFGAAQAVVVLQTPDDVAHLHESLTYEGDPECDPQMQPRPNVLFEAGMAMGRDENRTVIVELGKIKTFSDIHGRHVVRLDNSMPRRQDLASRLRVAGCSVNTDGTDWHTAGDLTPPAPPGGGLPLGRKLPSSQSSGLPRLGATYSPGGGSKMGSISITNYGPGDVYDLDVEPAAGEDNGFFREDAELPIPRLPEHKSVKVLKRLPMTLGSRRKSYFNVNITARTADGTPIDLVEFVSAG
jgi:hypothetical protein